jgi:hypothetical protein
MKLAALSFATRGISYTATLYLIDKPALNFASKLFQSQAQT